MPTSWFRRRRHYQSFTHQPLPVSWYQYSLFHPLTHTTTINIKSLFISTKYSKIIQIAVHIWKSFKTFQKHHKNLLKRLIYHTNSTIAATAKLTPSDLRSSKLACNMSLPCPRSYAVLNLCPPLRHPARAFRKAPGSTELTCYCAPTFPSFA